ncbi:MAG: radical SAM protein [Myxococcota bacterium]
MRCTRVCITKKAALSRQLDALAFERCIPLYATLELTLRCNLRCVHCYNFDRAIPLPKVQRDQELTQSEIHSLIDDLNTAGCLYMVFSGGEAMLHPHLLDYVSRARQHHMHVTVKTNGMFLSEQRTQALIDAGVGAIEVSLYGATASVHDGFTTVPGSFQQTTDGLRTARRLGLETIVSYCLTRQSVEGVAQVRDLCDSLGFSLRVDPQLTARYDGTTSSLDHRVSREQLQRAYAGPLRGLIQAPSTDPERSVQCGCARSVCGITSTGDVYPCIGAPIASGNLRQQSFGKIWRDSPEFKKIRDLGLNDFTTCKPCPDRAYCRRSSGVVFANSGDYTGAEPFTCMEASVIRDVWGSAKDE